jgi:hypothetical protein
VITSSSLRHHFAVIALCLSSCVGTGELREIASGMQDTDAEVSQLFATVADLVDERTNQTLTGLGEAAEGGLVGVVGAALAAYGLARRKRKQLLEPTA